VGWHTDSSGFFLYIAQSGVWSPESSERQDEELVFCAGERLMCHQRR
jgi:hypothetical protein